MSTVCWRRDKKKHSINASIARPLCRQLPDASAIINIGISVLDAVADLILFTVFGWVWLMVFDWIWLIFYPIELKFNTFFSIRVSSSDYY